MDYVCDQCWNTEAGLCRECAPSAEVEAEAAFAAGKVQAVGEKAALEGIHEGKHMDVKTRRQLVCPACGAETQGAKFCPECGAKLATPDVLHGVRRRGARRARSSAPSAGRPPLRRWRRDGGR